MLRQKLVLLAALCTGPISFAQGFTIDLPVDAVLIKLNKGFENMALTEQGAQGPALNGIIYAMSDKETHQIQLKVYHRPREVTVQQIKENGYLFVRYLIPQKELKKYFTYDDSKVMHTAPELATDFYCTVSKGAVVNGSVTQGLNGLTAGRYWSYCHARAMRGAKFGFMDLLKSLSGDLRITPYDFEKEMKTYWLKSDPDELVLVDVVADVLPTNDKLVVEGLHSRVWGLVDDSYLPYTSERSGVRVAGLSFVSDPQAGMPNLGDYLKKVALRFKSNGAIEKMFMDGLKASMGAYVHIPNQASVPVQATPAATGTDTPSVRM